MFKVDFFVDDKNLPHILRLVTGRVMNLQVVPVVNAVQEKKRGRPNGKLVQDADHTLGLFCKQLKKLGGEEGVINAEKAKAALLQIGMSPTSYSHFLAQAVKANLIKKGKKEGNKLMWSWV